MTGGGILPWELVQATGGWVSPPPRLGFCPTRTAGVGPDHRIGCQNCWRQGWFLGLTAEPRTRLISDLTHSGGGGILTQLSVVSGEISKDCVHLLVGWATAQLVPG